VKSDENEYQYKKYAKTLPTLIHDTAQIQMLLLLSSKDINSKF